MNRSKRTLWLGVGLLFGAIAAQAQQPPQGASPVREPWMMMGRGMMQSGMPGCGMLGMMMGTNPGYLDDRIGGQLAYLKAELRISDAQAKAWDAFADVYRKSAERMLTIHRQMWASEEWRKLPLPERLVKQQELMTQRLESSQLIGTALAQLYAALSKEQQQALESLMPSCGMM